MHVMRVNGHIHTNHIVIFNGSGVEHSGLEELCFQFDYLAIIYCSRPRLQITIIIIIELLIITCTLPLALDDHY